MYNWFIHNFSGTYLQYTFISSSEHISFLVYKLDAKLSPPTTLRSEHELSRVDHVDNSLMSFPWTLLKGAIEIYACGTSQRSRQGFTPFRSLGCFNSHLLSLLSDMLYETHSNSFSSDWALSFSLASEVVFQGITQGLSEPCPSSAPMWRRLQRPLNPIHTHPFR